MPTRSLSIEDRKLNTGAKITASSNRFYSDIDLSFKKKKNGDIFTKTDANAVKQAVKNLILTNHYEKPFSPFFGGNIRDMLFENMSPIVAAVLARKIEDVIQNFEPRCRLVSVRALPDFDRNIYNVTIEFYVVNAPTELVDLSVMLERIR